MKNVTPATLFVGGWFDAEDLSGPLKLFRAVEKDGAKASNTLVMGPVVSRFTFLLEPKETAIRQREEQQIFFDLAGWRGGGTVRSPKQAEL